MDDLSTILKLGALAAIAVGALWIAYKGLTVAVKCAKWIYMVSQQPPPPPQADARPVPERDERAGEAGNIVGFRQEWRQTG
jgi:hypothetical protein